MTSRRNRPRHGSVFEQLDTLFDSERGPNGEPSATDFLVLELPPIIERVATDFDSLPEIVDGVGAGRMLVASGLLVRATAVFAFATSDTTIDLIGLTIER